MSCSIPFSRVAQSAIGAVALMFCSSAHAWVGGPFSNNSFGTANSLNGTYQAVMRGKNAVGVMILGMTASPQYRDTGLNEVTRTGTASSTYSQLFDLTGNEGRFAMFVNGTVVVGTASGSIDMSGRKISAVLEGSRNRGDQTISKQSIQQYATNGVSTSGSATTKQYLFRDVLYVAGDFDAKFQKSYPVQRFDGSGDLQVNDPTGMEEVVVSTGTDVFGQKTVVTKIVPKVEKTEITIRVNGVKTSDTQPFFKSGLTVESPTVTPL